MSTQKMKYGYFSPSAARSFGVCVYLKPDGKQVDVTSIGETENPKDWDYQWDDAVCIGEVTEFVVRFPSKYGGWGLYNWRHSTEEITWTKPGPAWPAI